MPVHGGSSVVYDDPLHHATAYVGYDAQKQGFSNYFLATGVADDVPIQAAIDYVAALGGGGPGGGGLVYVEEGLYEVTATIYLVDGVSVWGAGINGTTLTLADNANCHMVEWSPTDTEFFAGLYHMRLFGNGTHNVTGHGLFTTAANGGAPADFHAAHVMFSTCAEDGVHLDSSWGYKFTDCLFENNERDGFYAEGDQLSVLGFYAALNHRHGMNITPNTSNSWFVGSCRSNDLIGFYCLGNRNQGLIHASNNGRDGIYIVGDSCTFSVTTWDNSKDNVGVYYNLYLLGGIDNNIRGWARGGADVAADVHAGGTHQFYWLRYDTIVYEAPPAEYTQIVNGHATNPGDPDAVAPWNALVKDDGLVIRDTVNNLTYVYDSRVAGLRYTI